MSSFTSSFDDHIRASAPWKGARFVAIWAICLTAILGVVSATNAAVDPLNRLGLNRLGIFHSAEFEYKLARLPVANFDAVLIGASTIANINPDMFPDVKIFNAGFSGALPEEMSLFIRANSRTLRGKLVIMGLDFFMFNERRKSTRGETLVAPAIDAVLKYVVSIKTLFYSASTVAEYLRGTRPKIMTNGARRIDELLDGDRRLTTPDYGEHTDNIVNFLYRDYEFSTRRVAELVRLRDFMQREGIQFQLVMNPQNRQVTKATIEAGYGEQFMRYQRDLKKAFPDVQNYADSDLSGESHFFLSNSMYFNEATMRVMVTNALNAHGIR